MVLVLSRFKPRSMRTSLLLLSLSGLLALASCKKDNDEPSPVPPAGDTCPRLILKFKFDSTQVRLDAFGQPLAVPAGHGAQSPRFNTMSAHYAEFAPTMFTALGAGDVVYHAAETTAGGSTAIDFAQGVRVGDGATFLNIPLSTLSPGSYEWLRVSLAYQNYDVDFRAFGLDMSGTVASFIGYNTYIASYLVADSTVQVNGNKAQRYWAFEVNDPLVPVQVAEGQAPGTTVVNPLFATSPIPSGSCVVTGAFDTPLTITGAETSDVVILVSLSTNNSFEWTETDGDNVYEPADGETVVDMGVRGMIPIVQ